MLQKDLIKILIISIISLAADLIVFYTLFIILFYIDIRNQHTNTNKNKEYTIKDIKKLITTLGIAEMVIFQQNFFQHMPYPHLLYSMVLKYQLQAQFLRG